MEGYILFDVDFFDMLLTEQRKLIVILSFCFRVLLNQVVNLKAECYHWSKLRKETAEEYLTRFLDSEVKLLWPKGWMSTKILYKESKDGHAFITLVFSQLYFSELKDECAQQFESIKNGIESQPFLSLEPHRLS